MHGIIPVINFPPFSCTYIIKIYIIIKEFHIHIAINEVISMMECGMDRPGIERNFISNM